MSALFPLRVRGAVSRRRGKTLLGPVDLDWDGQGACVVIGPNGSGKTTLLRVLHGLARLHAGRIDWACARETARAAQAFVFQRPVLLRRSVQGNIAYPLHLRGTPKRQAAAEARAWAERVGLGDMLARSAASLSGGEQQKLALARALIGAPELVFLDEPCAALDGRATREIETILQGAQAAGCRLMLTTHDMGQARRLAAQVIFMHAGRVIEHGLAARFFAAPQSPQARAFLNGDIVE